MTFLTSIEQAMIKIYDGEFKNGFIELSAAYDNGEKDSSVLQELRRGFWEPNLTEMKTNYQKNSEFLLTYPYIFTKKFVPPEENRYLLFPLSEELFYCFDLQGQKFMPLETGSDYDTKYFFKNLDDPILVESEYNLYNLRFLQDNVRDSRYFGRDNHIYLHYEDIQTFSLLLYYSDISALCNEWKFVFLIGAESDLYPLDFRSQFNAEFNLWRERPLSVDEIKRVCVFYFTSTHCGNALIDSLMDSHPNLLTIKEFGLSSFPSFYDNCLKTQSVDSFIANLLENTADKKYLPFFTFFNKIYPSSDAALPDAQEFLAQLKLLLKDISQPTKLQWFVAFCLANALSLGRNMHSRIVPAVFHALHSVWNNQPEIELGNMLEIYHEFPYVKVFSAVRRPDSRIAGEIKYEMKCRELYHLENCDSFSYLFIHCGAWKNIDWRRVYFDEHAHFSYHQMAVIRFEDVKRAPKETLSRLCSFLNIPWSDMLLRCTHNGAQTIYSDAGTLISDFDPAPLAPEYYRAYLNDFDRYRLELLYAQEYEMWNYTPQFYCGIAYSEQEIKSLYAVPFEFEGPSSKWTTEYKQKREDMLRGLDGLLKFWKEFDRKLRSGVLRPCQLLSPNQEESEEQS